MSSGRDSSYKQSRRTQLPEEVAAYVRELIFSGTVRPGEFLRMEPIAEAVGVSNTPVREGLLTLASEGFVKLVPRRGFMVASFSPHDIRDIFWVQGQIAGELAARAAKSISDEEIAQLERTHRDFVVAMSKRLPERVHELGREFHVIINRAADAHRLALLLESVVSQLPRDFYSTIEGRIDESREYHPKLLDAMRNRQARVARTLMTQHIQRSADHLIADLDKRGTWPNGAS